MKQILTYILIFLIGIILSCKDKSTNPPDDYPPGYQHDIPWPSLADSPWPMFQKDPQNSGRSNLSGPMQGQIKWKSELTFGVSPSFFNINHKKEVLVTYSSVKPDSTVKTSDYLLSFSVLGELLWYHNLCKPNSNRQDEISAPVTTYDGITYTSSPCGILFSLRPDNSVLWEFDAGEPIYNGVGGLNIDKEGNIYFSTISKFYSLDKNANIRWTKDKYGRQKAVFSADGSTIYIKSEGTIDALNIGGTLKWSYPITSGDYLLFLISDSQSNIYFADNKYFYSITPLGELRWDYKIETSDDFNYDISPTMDKNGNIYFSTRNYFYSLNYEGKLRWKLEGIGKGGSHLINDINGNVFVADCLGGKLYSVSNEGNINWFLNLGVDSYIYSALAIGENSTLYILTENPKIASSTIYAIY